MTHGLKDNFSHLLRQIRTEFVYYSLAMTAKVRCLNLTNTMNVCVHTDASEKLYLL